MAKKIVARRSTGSRQKMKKPMATKTSAAATETISVGREGGGERRRLEADRHGAARAAAAHAVDAHVAAPRLLVEPLQRVEVVHGDAVDRVDVVADGDAGAVGGTVRIHHHSPAAVPSERQRRRRTGVRGPLRNDEEAGPAAMMGDAQPPGRETDRSGHDCNRDQNPGPAARRRRHAMALSYGDGGREL